MSPSKGGPGEHQRFGGDGFEMMVERVARLEQAIGINDLARMTAT